MRVAHLGSGRWPGTGDWKIVTESSTRGCRLDPAGETVNERLIDERLITE